MTDEISAEGGDRAERYDGDSADVVAAFDAISLMTVVRETDELTGVKAGLSYEAADKLAAELTGAIPDAWKERQFNDPVESATDGGTTGTAVYADFEDTQSNRVTGAEYEVRGPFYDTEHIDVEISVPLPGGDVRLGFTEAQARAFTTQVLDVATDAQRERDSGDVDGGGRSDTVSADGGDGANSADQVEHVVEALECVDWNRVEGVTAEEAAVFTQRLSAAEADQ